MMIFETKVDRKYNRYYNTYFRLHISYIYIYIINLCFIHKWFLIKLFYTNLTFNPRVWVVGIFTEKIYLLYTETDFLTRK